jgi:hypothetical protein
MDAEDAGSTYAMGTNDLWLEITGICTIIFTYYFDPTPNDRNLEWDTKKNLFSGLTSMETPREP